ncbi:hypothetical protein C2E23DRAFT_829032 [Lenzites betulinus]|nr:hypothetical protein C2E23DRAFT_829032 [Lenzites betulinus]
MPATRASTDSRSGGGEHCAPCVPRPRGVRTGVSVQAGPVRPPGTSAPRSDTATRSAAHTE